MRERLPDDRDELRAGKISAGIFLSDYRKRVELIERVPLHLRERVKGIISHLDSVEVEKLSESISALKTRKERNEALRNLPFNFRSAVKELVINLFETRNS